MSNEQADDWKSLCDILDARDALDDAQEGLRKAMAGDERARARFLFNCGFARGRLARVHDRFYAAKEGEHA